MGRKKSCKPMKELYAEWMDSLRSTLLPVLRQSLQSSSSASADVPIKLSHSGGAFVSSSDLLRTHVQSIHSHFQAYYASLDIASRHDASQLLSPDWRSPLEKPFLFLGDLHPQLFTNLLRSLLNDSHPHLSSPQLLAKIDQIDRGLRLIVPSINQRFRDAQSCFVARIAEEWAKAKAKEAALDEAVREQMEELGGVFADANRARRSVLAEIVGAVDDYLGALFLEVLSELVVGFWDADLLHQFQQCRVPLSPGSP